MKCKIFKLNNIVTVIHKVKFYLIKVIYLKTKTTTILAITSLHNRSIDLKPLMNTTIQSPSHTTVSVQPNTSAVQNSFLNGAVSKADLPCRSLAHFGVLSKYN